ncbi:hypothetical protein NIES4071_60790 [Calothrix sp. NIES-4071]|nr:hypothetical protein NIES4071_60790 [Calothrix sp. NIES-4071]BAZ60386.1 hypothetical protein NIES4105_60740 [Calothrix sp. NIES-4105]
MSWKARILHSSLSTQHSALLTPYSAVSTFNLIRVVHSRCHERLVEAMADSGMVAVLATEDSGYFVSTGADLYDAGSN